MRNFTVVYNGMSGVTVDAYNKNMSVLIETFTNVQDGDLLTVNGYNSHGTLDSKTKIILGSSVYTIHTSCSENILGKTYGPFTVIHHTDKQGNECGEIPEPPTCTDDIACQPISAPTLLNPPTHMVVATGNPITVTTNPPFIAGLNAWCNEFSAVIINAIWDTCIFVRPGTPAQVNSAGILQFASSNVPNGGYIMKSIHQELDHTLPASNVPYVTAMSQAEYDAGDEFWWFMGLAFETAENIELCAVSEWRDLQATCVVNGNVATVSWLPENVPDCADENWEIVVTLRDESKVCPAANPEWTFHLGDTATIGETQKNIQLHSGVTPPPHNIVQCAAYAYPVCNKSPSSVVSVATCAD